MDLYLEKRTMANPNRIDFDDIFVIVCLNIFVIFVVSCLIKFCKVYREILQNKFKNLLNVSWREIYLLNWNQFFESIGIEILEKQRWRTKTQNWAKRINVRMFSWILKKNVIFDQQILCKYFDFSSMNQRTPGLLIWSWF